MNIDLNKKSREQLVNSPEFAQEVERLGKLAKSDDIHTGDYFILSKHVLLALKEIPFAELRISFEDYKLLSNGSGDGWNIPLTQRACSIVMSSIAVLKEADKARSYPYIRLVEVCVNVHDICSKVMTEVANQAIKNIETRQKLTV